MNRSNASRPHGFTLIEVLVVIFIIAVLVALTLPAVQSSREAARRTQCVNNLHQIGLAVSSHVDAQKVLPPGYKTETPYLNGPEYGPGLGWGVLVLPYMEQSVLFNSYNLSLDMQLFHSENETFRRVVLDVYLCPSSPGSGPVKYDQNQPQSYLKDVAAGQYVASMGESNYNYTIDVSNGLFCRNSKVAIADIADGTSTTIMIGERSRNVLDSTWVGNMFLSFTCTNPGWPNSACIPSYMMMMAQTSPNALDQYVEVPNYPLSIGDDFWSLHPGGCNFLFADGSVKFIKQSISPRVFYNLTTRANGEVIDQSSY